MDTAMHGHGEQRSAEISTVRMPAMLTAARPLELKY
jgi:hypothetical protein